MRPSTCLLILVAVSVNPGPAAGDSLCYGTTARGSLENGCRLPVGGKNFRAYSRIGSWLGRTYVHCRVAAVIESSFESLAESRPDAVFVYGETGLKDGGPFKPHKTHQNGLSVDFMVPVLDRGGRSVPLPTTLANKLGYSLEFDSEGKLDDLTIDYEAIVAHLAALKASSEAEGIGIWRVIFDPQLQPRLRQARGWSEISDLTFSDRPSWVRHDEHYHVDFELPCEPHRSGG